MKIKHLLFCLSLILILTPGCYEEPKISTDNELRLVGKWECDNCLTMNDKTINGWNFYDDRQFSVSLFTSSHSPGSMHGTFWSTNMLEIHLSSSTRGGDGFTTAIKKEYNYTILSLSDSILEVSPLDSKKVVIFTRVE